MKKIILCLFVFCVSFSSLYSENSYKFFWNLKKGERIESVKNAQVEYYENGILKQRYEERNIIDLTAYATISNGYRVGGVFKVFRRYNNNDVFRLEKEYKSDFIIQTNGRYIVPREHFMPNIRHIPTFPNEALSVGDVWNAEVIELIEDMGGGELTMVLASDYLFAGIEKDDEGRDNALIQYHIIIDKDLFQAGIKGKNYPERIYGFNYGAYIWDIDKNVPVGQTERFQILFGYGKDYSYGSIEYKMNIVSSYKIYEEVSEREEEDAIVKIEEHLKDSGGVVTVDTVPEGLVIRLNEILFDTDSSILKNSSKNALLNAIEAIKENYPDREIIVEGHTDNTGRKEYNQTLSEKRAKTVADYINKEIKHGKVSYKGYADDKPVDSNATQEGRARNRRVDIIIKLR